MDEQYKQNVRELKQITNNYNRSLQELIRNGVNLGESYVFDPVVENDPKNYWSFNVTTPQLFEAERTILSVNYSLSVLPRNLQMVLWSEFFRKSDKKWWSGYYSKSAFYRLRKEAVIAFMNIQKNE